VAKLLPVAAVAEAPLLTAVQLLPPKALLQLQLKKKLLQAAKLHLPSKLHLPVTLLLPAMQHLLLTLQLNCNFSMR
jgi:hypothetical protein